LSDAFKDTTEFQQVLAVFYADILGFHKTAYKFFRKRGRFVYQNGRDSLLIMSRLDFIV